MVSDKYKEDDEIIGLYYSPFVSALRATPRRHTGNVLTHDYLYKRLNLALSYYSHRNILIISQVLKSGKV